MGSRPKRPCSVIGCRNLVTPPARYCEAHRDRERVNQYRGNTTERGYGSDYQRKRQAFMQQHDVCETCWQAPSTELHHIDGNPHNNDVSNWKAVCASCHRKADAERRRRR